MRRMFVPLLLVVATVATVTHVRSAEACKYAAPEAFVLAPVTGDDTPPSAAQVVSKIKEPDSRKTAGCALPGGCGDIGTITLTLSAHDDRALPVALGYQVKIVGDAGGVMMAMPAGTLVAKDGVIVIPWRGEDAFSVAFEVRAVDPNGNVGPPTSHTVTVPASFPWKLAFAIGGPVLLVLAIIGIVRRRRRR